MTEEQLQAKCVEWFHNNYHAERGALHCNNNNSHNKIAGNIARTLGVYPGVSDLELLVDGGRTVFIELKVGAGKPSTVQLEWRSFVVSRGFGYFIVYTLEEFKQLIKQLI